MSSPTPLTTRPDPAPTVLVVEDEPSLADSIQYSLEREGFQVQIAADGERAISRFREGRPSLVLLDLMLPKLSGLDVCRIIRQESTIPIGAPPPDCHSEVAELIPAAAHPSGASMSASVIPPS